jgi:predicted RNA binding protein YcfA (HicA-like mRNA interferase family)
MSDKLPTLRVADAIRKLWKAGFVFDRQAKGSHEIWLHPQTHRRVVIANHPGDIPKGTLRKMIQQAGLTVDEFNGL